MNKRKSEQKPKKEPKKFIKEDEEDDFNESDITSEVGDKDRPEFLGTELSEEPWERPAPILKPESMDLEFQNIDIDYEVRAPLKGMPGNQNDDVAIIRIFGITKEGNSVVCKVHGFMPYLYVQAPPNFKTIDCEKFRHSLNEKMKNSAMRAQKLKGDYILEVKIVQKQTIMGYYDQFVPYLEITSALPKFVPTIRSILESGFSFDGVLRQYITYESNILFILRFMIDVGMVGCSWVKLPKGTYYFSDEKVSHCQIEVDIAFNDLVCYTIDERPEMAPFRILSFDIECAGRKGVFPEPEKDPVIQIANYITVQGSNKPMVRNIFTLKSCSSIVGAQVFSFDNEAKMLEAWRDFIISVDPDIITGYNTANFDIPYLIKRADNLKCKKATYLGKIKEKRSRVKDASFSSKAYGTRESKETNMEGRVSFDLLQVIQRDYKLRSYTLNAVSAEFLGEQKEEVHHSIISDLWKGSDEDRRRLAVYCLKDAYLPQRLLDKLMCLVNYIEMARVTGVPLSFLLARGQQIKVLSQLYRAAYPKNVLIPAYSPKKVETTYEGATVVEPKKGFYDTPITTLDFASLYPSIMIAHNLCYTTLVINPKNTVLKEDDMSKTPLNHFFVKPTVKKGILPEILENLLTARSKAKKDLANATDNFQKMIYNGRQLALKISANSVYGFTGATVGKLPCLEISAAVTAYGRTMLEMTRTLVQEKYCIKNGYKFDADVVYGDTDSVMVKFGLEDMKEAMKLGQEAAKEITKHFPPPIKLEFEKCYFPYLLISKKRYAGLFWTKPDKWDKMDTKGIETVRRDNCPLVRNVITTVLNKILIDRNVQSAENYVKDIVMDLLGNRLDLSLLVISKSYSKKEEDYTGKQPHIELAKRMMKRDPGTAPHVGDRVPYVIIQSTKNAKAYEKAEDPLFVLENNLPLDYKYYLENQLSGPLLRIFKPILKNPSSLITGEHTRSITIPTPKTGGILNFTKKKLTCMNCKTPLSGNQSTVCSSCEPYQLEIYQKTIQCISKLEFDFSAAWTQCQRCQGSLHQDVLCSARDCPIFYRRKKVQKDIMDSQEMLDRFENWF